jgi:hypothetical protein
MYSERSPKRTFNMVDGLDSIKSLLGGTLLGSLFADLIRQVMGLQGQIPTQVAGAVAGAILSGIVIYRARSSQRG